MLQVVERNEHEDFFYRMGSPDFVLLQKIKDEASLWIVVGSKHLAKLVARICALCLCSFSDAFFVFF